MMLIIIIIIISCFLSVLSYLQKRLHVCQAECLAPGAYGKIFWKQPFRGNRRDCFAIQDSIKFSRPFPFAMNHEHFSSQLFIRYPSSILHIELGRISSYSYGGLKTSCVGWSSGDVGGDGSPAPKVLLWHAGLLQTWHVSVHSCGWHLREQRNRTFFCFRYWQESYGPEARSTDATYGPSNFCFREDSFCFREDGGFAPGKIVRCFREDSFCFREYFWKFREDGDFGVFHCIS